MKWEETPQEGQHTYTYKDGTVYTGEFKNHLRHGQGKLSALDEQFIYDGEWRNDVFHGKGNLKKSGIQCEGEFRRGYQHGQCKQIYKNDQIIESNYRQCLQKTDINNLKFYIFSKGQFHGDVILKCSNQIYFQAVYREGSLIQIKKEEEFKFPENSAEISTKGIMSIFQKMAFEDTYDKEDFIPLNSLKKGLRMTSGKLFSKNMKYCLTLTNRGTLKIISVVRQKEVWNNSYSDPNNKPYFFWINPETGQFQVVSCYGVTFSTNTTGNNVYVVMRNSGICEILDGDTQKVLQTLNDV